MFLGLSVRFESRVLSTPGSITGGAIVPFITILRPHAHLMDTSTHLDCVCQLVFTADRVDIHVCDVICCEVSNGSQIKGRQNSTIEVSLSITIL